MTAALPANFARVWPGAVLLLDLLHFQGLSLDEALDRLPAEHLPTRRPALDIFDAVVLNERPPPPATDRLPAFMREAEERAPMILPHPTHFEREVMRKVYTHADLAAMLTQARQEAEQYPEAVETRENRLGALRNALRERERGAGRVYRAPQPRVTDDRRRKGASATQAPPVTREQWAAIDAMDADLLGQTMGLARVRGGIECPLHKGDHEAKVYRSRRGAMHWRCFRADQGGGALELYSAVEHGGIPTGRDQRREVAAEMVARGLV